MIFYRSADANRGNLIIHSSLLRLSFRWTAVVSQLRVTGQGYVVVYSVWLNESITACVHVKMNIVIILYGLSHVREYSYLAVYRDVMKYDLIYDESFKNVTLRRSDTICTYVL